MSSQGFDQILRLDGHDFSCRASLTPASPGAEDLPVVVALHGGTYSSRYFDVPGCSLIRRAEALGIPIVALDRPGYGNMSSVGGALSHSDAAVMLQGALDELWHRHGRGRAGIVLLGHSIGAAIAFRIAARHPRWPLLGVAASGIGLRNAPGNAATRAALPQTPFVELSGAVKDQMMFGQPGTFLMSAADAARSANALTPRQDLIDIASDWPGQAVQVLAAVKVPIHYRQADHDRLWVVSHEEVREFASACSSAARVDAEIVSGAGHCIDFHRAGARLHLEQLAFALRCACDRALSTSDQPTSIAP